MNKLFYIRPYRESDREEILKIWYKESLKSHSFIPGKYWEGHMETLKTKYLPESETYVADNDSRILGFISLIGNYIGALFVDEDYQGKGVGTALIAFAHKKQGGMFVDVYKENDRARRFYTDYGFKERREKVQPETGHTLITMYAGPSN